MSDVTERAKAALEGVTPGPWTWDGDTFSDAPQHKCPHDTQWTDHGPNLIRGNEDGSRFEEWDAANDVITSSGYDASSLEIKTADAEFIMNARDLVPELVAELETTRAELAQLREAADFADSIMSLLHYRGLVDSDNNRRDVAKATDMLARLRKSLK